MTTFWDEKFRKKWPAYLHDQQEVERAAKEQGAVQAAIAQGLERGKVSLDGRVEDVRSYAVFDQLKIYLPVSLTLDRADPSAHEQAIYVDKRRALICGFTWMTHSLNPDRVEFLRDTLTSGIRQGNPSIQVVQEETLSLHEVPLSTLEYVATVAGGMLYHLMFVTILQGRAFIGSFQFGAEEAVFWQSFFRAAVQLMEVTKR